MGGLSRFNAPGGFQPAGYLPAPKQARFISEAEQAAEKLPATIKSQSLKNALLKGGAKPLELEYAGIDDFIAQNQGKPVSAADVLAHLRTEGPLGQLKRVEQQVVNGRPASNDIGGDGIPFGLEDHAQSGGLPVPPAYAENIRAPFDPEFASDTTRYHSYTVPGKNGDFTGYREVLLEDPKNSKGTSDRMIPTSEDGEMRLAGPVDAHRSDYWTRYNEYDDRIAVQNIQSDVGQEYTKGKSNQDQLNGMNAHLRDLQQRAQEILQELSALPQGGGAARIYNRLEAELGQTKETINDLLASADHYRFQVTQDAVGRQFLTQDTLPVSPIAKDSNWKNLMARHIALQSINGGGKPITIPTGKQMVDVEGFGRGTHDDEGGAARAATDFNTDLVRRLQKIFRGLHKDGAEVIETATAPRPEPLITAISKREAELERKHFMGERTYDLEEVIASLEDKARNAELEGKSVDDLLDFDDPDGPNYIPPVNAMGEDDAGGGWSYDNLVASGLEKLKRPDRKVFNILSSGGNRADLEATIQAARNHGDALSPEFLKAAMDSIQYDRLMEEMGHPGVLAGAINRRGPWEKLNPDAPGWTIKPSPMAVRQGLEKGLPIMSLLAPLLMSQQQEQQ